MIALAFFLIYLYYNNPMKYIFCLIFIILLSACSSLSVGSVNYLAKLGDYQSVDDIVYAKNPSNTLDIYIPSAAPQNKPFPVIIFIYGGCWGECVSLYKEDYEFVADALTSKGYLVVIPNYTMSPEVMFKEMIKDLEKVITWTKKDIKTYNGDSNNIFIMGHSSGAHLALMLSLNEEYLNQESRASIRGGIGISGPYDFIPYTQPYLTRVFGKQEDAQYSQILNFVHENEVPLLLMYGKEDKVIHKRNIINLTKKVQDIKEEVKAKYYEGLDHQGIISAFTRPFRDDVLLSDIDQFVKSNLKTSSKKLP